MSSATAFLLLLPLVGVVGACGAPGPKTGPPPPGARRTVILGGTIHTGDPAQPRVGALVLEGYTLLLAGSRKSAEPYVEGAAEVVRLPENGAVTPGLIDAHLHLEGLGRRERTLDLVGTGSLADILTRVADYASAVAGTGWILGRGWDQNDWPDRKWPTAADLDAVVPSRPVSLERIDGHALWLNSAALEAAGIGPETQDPEGGRIVRDEEGNPIGILVDQAAGLAEEAIPDPEREERRAALLAGAWACARGGLTMVHDMGVDRETVEIYRELAEAGDLPVRVYAYIAGAGDLLQEYIESGPEIGAMFSVRGVKLFADGAMGSRGAALLEDYADDPGNRGLVVMQSDRIEAITRRCLEAGLQVATHAIGDRANRLVLDAYERALAAVPTARDPRLRIEHAQHLHPHDVERLSRSGVIASMQPTHCTSDAPWVTARLGAGRLRGSYAWRSLLDSGTVLAFGSDAPVESERPVLGLEAAVRRADPEDGGDEPFLPEESVSIAEALAAFTRGAAHASYDEGRLGMLRPGFAADLVIWTADPLDVPAAELDALMPARVIVGGRTVFPETQSDPPRSVGP
jgi:predicted amidohydrolase YtcJ